MIHAGGSKLSVLFHARDPRHAIKRIKANSISLVALKVPRVPKDHPKALPFSKSIIKTIHACKSTLVSDGIVAVLSFKDQDSIVDYLSNQMFEFTHNWCKGSDGCRMNLFSANHIPVDTELIPTGGTKRSCAEYLRSTGADVPVVRFSDTKAFALRSHRNLLKTVIRTFSHGPILMPYFDGGCLSVVMEILWDHHHGIPFPGFQVAAITTNKQRFESCKDSITLEDSFRFTPWEPTHLAR